jgi:translation initiation factor 5B
MNQFFCFKFYFCRVKSEYVHHASLQGAIGVKIVAPDIGRAVAGTPVMVIREVG